MVKNALLQHCFFCNFASWDFHVLWKYMVKESKLFLRSAAVYEVSELY